MVLNNHLYKPSFGTVNAYVYMLKVNFLEWIKNETNYRGGTLNLIHGNKHFLSNSVLAIKPEVGDFYFFPNYLMHTVYPFKGTDEERRSISFNADIDEEIYNVYGSS